MSPNAKRTAAHAHVTRPAPMHWWLLIDESGAFEDLTDDTVCGGLLVRRDRPGHDPLRLRQALDAAAPELVWPFHAAHLRVAVLIALASHVRGIPAQYEIRPGVLPPADVVARLAGVLPAELNVVLDAIRNGTRMPYVALRKLRDALRALEPMTYGALLERGEVIRAGIHRVAQALAAPDPSSGIPGALTVVAAEAWTGAAGDSSLPDFTRGSDRYLCMMKTILPRAAEVLHRLPGPHDIKVQVLTRDVYDPIIGRGTRLHARHIAPMLGGLPASTHMRLDAIYEFDARVPEGLVLADFTVNMARGEMRNGWNASLAIVESAITAHLPPIRSGVPSKTHIAIVERAALAAGTRVPPWRAEARREW